MASPTITVTVSESAVSVAVTLGVTAAQVLAALGIDSYADIAEANAALGIGKVYYDIGLLTLNITTA